jgi:hypothetical protein
MTVIRGVTVGLALWASACLAGSEREPYPSADHFIALIQSRNFDEAAESFYIPPAYPAKRTLYERASIAKFMEALFQEAGSLQTPSRKLPQGALEWWTLAISGGEHPYSPKEIGADASDVIIYRGHTAKEPLIELDLAYARVKTRWTLLSCTFGLPKSDPDALRRLQLLSSKILLQMPAPDPSWGSSKPAQSSST